MSKRSKKSFRVGGDEQSLTVRRLDGTNRRGRWRVEWYPRGGGGKPRTRALGWLSKSKAEAAALQLLASGLTTTAPETTTAGEIRTVTDVLEIYNGAAHARSDLRANSLESYRGSLGRLNRFVGKMPVRQLGKSVATTYRDAYLAHRDGSGTRTVAQDLQVLRMAVRYLIQQGASLVVPPRVPLRISRTYNHSTPAPADVGRVLDALTVPWHRAVLCLLWGTGARVGDLSVLTWGDVTEHAIHIPAHTKTGARTIPLGPLPRAREGIAILRAHYPGTPEASIWPPREIRKSLGSALNRYADRVGVPRFSPHGLRRLAVDEMRQAGLSLEVAAAITGHSPVTMMKHYRKVNPMEIVAGLERARLGEVPAGDVLTLTNHPYRKKYDAG